MWLRTKVNDILSGVEGVGDLDDDGSDDWRDISGLAALLEANDGEDIGDGEGGADGGEDGVLDIGEDGVDEVGQAGGLGEDLGHDAGDVVEGESDVDFSVDAKYVDIEGGGVCEVVLVVSLRWSAGLMSQ